MAPWHPVDKIGQVQDSLRGLRPVVLQQLRLVVL